MKVMLILLRLTLGALLSGLLATTLVAQHLPEGQLGRGPVERTLSGVLINHTPVTDLERRLGKPTKVEKLPFPDNATLGSLCYWWDVTGVRLRTCTAFRSVKGTRVKGPVHSVETWGVHPTVLGVGVTGAGLALGDTLAKIRHFYGPRFALDHQAFGCVTVTVQWKDATTLLIHLDERDRIDYMNLSAVE